MAPGWAGTCQRGFLACWCREGRGAWWCRPGWMWLCDTGYCALPFPGSCVKTSPSSSSCLQTYAATPCLPQPSRAASWGLQLCGQQQAGATCYLAISLCQAEGVGARWHGGTRGGAIQIPLGMALGYRWGQAVPCPGVVLCVMWRVGVGVGRESLALGQAGPCTGARRSQNSRNRDFSFF